MKFYVGQVVEIHNVLDLPVYPAKVISIDYYEVELVVQTVNGTYEVIANPEGQVLFIDGKVSSDFFIKLVTVPSITERVGNVYPLSSATKRVSLYEQKQRAAEERKQDNDHILRRQKLGKYAPKGREKK